MKKQTATIELKVIQEGWVVITPTICQGDVMGWSTEDYNGNAYPLIFETREAAWKEIADEMIIELQQFIDGERELEDTNFSTDNYVASITVYEDGSFVVFSDGGDLATDIIIESTIEEWKSNL